MIGEGLIYRAFGIKRESPNVKALSVAAITAKSILYTRKHHTVIDGASIPSEGPVIITGNHGDESDIYKAVQAVRIKAGRWINPLMKAILTAKGAVESEEYLASIGTTREEALKEYKPLNAFILRGSGAISALRDRASGAVGKACLRVLDNNQVLGAYLQPHRYEDTTLENLSMAVANLAKSRPDVPVCSIASYVSPDGIDQATVLPPMTYNQLKQEYGRELNAAELTIIFADMTVTALPEKSQVDWAHRWSGELERLENKSPRRRTTHSSNSEL